MNKSKSNIYLPIYKQISDIDSKFKYKKMEIQWQPIKTKLLKDLSLEKVQQWQKLTVIVVTRERDRERGRYFWIKIFFDYASLTHTLQGTLFIYNRIDKTRTF